MQQNRVSDFTKLKAPQFYKKNNPKNNDCHSLPNKKEIKENLAVN